MARKSKNPKALDEALESSASPTAPAIDGALESAPTNVRNAMAKAERKKAAQVKPLDELRTAVEALLEKVRADADVEPEEYDDDLDALIEQAQKAEAKAQVLEHLRIGKTCDNATQIGDHLGEVLHVLKPLD